jgi:hypothetical protein
MNSADKAVQREIHQRHRSEKVVRIAEATAGLTFTPWPKIKRLNREIVITEKIDGTNAAIGIQVVYGRSAGVSTTLRVYAQSRTKIITPDDDNAGFARWVQENRVILIDTLGPGLHFGEWWGAGIQRSYGLAEKRFSLFNTAQWGEGEGALALARARDAGVAIYSVPVLYTGPWHIRGEHSSVFAPDHMIDKLAGMGSHAAPGFMRPEGIVIFHKASGTCLKATVEKDEEWKGRATTPRPE